MVIMVFLTFMSRVGDFKKVDYTHHLNFRLD